MAKQINIIIPIQIFFGEIKKILEDASLKVYIKRRKNESWLISEGIDSINNDFHAVYITAEVFDETVVNSFFDDSFAPCVIEVLGGHSTEIELENMSLRIISKAPDKRLTAFFSKLTGYLKSSPLYGQGIGPGARSFYNNTFYHQESIKGRIVWFDFDRKMQPIIIER